MALTTEQQAQVDIQDAIENNRHTNQLEVQGKTSRLEAVRLARDVLIENRRLDTESNTSDITAADIIAFAQEVDTYVNS